MLVPVNSSMSVLSRVNLLLGDKKEAKFRGVMSVQNIHYIPGYWYVLDLFYD